MLSHLPGILLGIGIFIAAGILTTLFRFVFLAIATALFGKRRFVEASGTDGCNYMVISGIVCTLVFQLLPVVDKARTLAHLSHLGPGLAWMIVLGIPALFALYAVLELRLWGAGHQTPEFAIQGDAVVRLRDGAALHPTRVVQEKTYHETALMCGYGLYALVLFNADGTAARNGYLSEDEMRQMLRRVLTLARPQDCRAMDDLCFVWPESQTRLQRATFGQEWAGVLCGSLVRLSAESRAWWQQWLMPEFPEDGLVSLPVPELASRFQELQQAYVALIQSESTLHVGCNALRMLIERAKTDVLLMTSGRFEVFVSRQFGQTQIVAHEDQGLAVYAGEPK